MVKYSILSVAKELGIRIKTPIYGNSAYCYCPFCNDNKAKLNLNLLKNTWRCNKCEESGGVTGLIEKVLGCSHKEALDWLHGSSSISGVEVYGNKNNGNTYISETYIADIKEMDRTYRKMLSMLSLNNKHLEDLKRRGLSLSAINKLGFKSVPSRKKGSEIAERLAKDGFTLKGVPGFYKTNGIWKMCDIPGYLIPFVNEKNQITGFQIRTDNPGSRNAKYMSFTSTGKPEGTQSSLKAHIIGYNGQSNVYLTEGALKADIASFLSYKLKDKKIAFMAIPGVSNYKSMQKTISNLKEMGVTTIFNCFDMDREGNKNCLKNENVERAVKVIQTEVEKQGLIWKPISWDYEKGIDDYMLKLAKKRALV